SGFVRPSSGRLRLAGHRIDDWSPAQRSRHGIARTFQNIGLDKTATVTDNLRIARDGGLLGTELRKSFGRRALAANRLYERAELLLARLAITDVLGERVTTLPVGTAKLVELVAVLLRRPRLLLLDEPAAGLGAAERERLGGL